MSVRTDVVNLNVNINGNQAQNELNQLRKRSADLTVEMKNLTKGTVEYKAAAKELSQVNDRMASLRKEIGLTALSQKELTAELKRMNALKNVMTPGTEEFKKLQKEIDGVKSRLTEIRTGLSGFKKMWADIGSEVKQFGLLAASYLGFEFIFSGMQHIISGAGRTSDSLAQLQIYMHGSAADAQELYQKLRQLDTRTSNSDLLDIASIVAKKGVAKEEIVGVTKALDQLLVVLGKEIGDPHEAVASLVKLVNVYSDDHHVTAKNISDIGAAIQGLTSSGVATGDFLISFAERLAGVRGITGITIQSVLGLGAALEELGQRNESASTAAQKLIIQMFLKPADYAKSAGLAVKDFSALLAKDPVEALIKVAATLKETGKAPQDLINAFGEMGVNGARVIGVLGDIAGNATYMRKRTEDAYKFFGNAGAITDAFNLKNENLGATLDKIGKKMAQAFTSSSLLAFLKDAAVGFARLIGAIDDSNKALDAFQKQKKFVDDLEKSMLPLIDDYDRLTRKAGELGGVTKLSTGEQDLLKKAIQGIAATIPGAITQFDEYGRAIGISTEEARKFLALQKLVLKEKNRDAITEADKTIASIEDQIATAKEQLAIAQKARREQAVAQPGAQSEDFGIKAQGHLIETLDKQITKAAVNLADLQNRLAGQKGIKAQLNGDPLIPDTGNVNSHPDVNNQKEEKEIQTIEKLKAKLQELKDAREKMDISDKASLATNLLEQKKLEAQINALEGKKDKAAAAAERKLETIAQKFAKLKAEAQRLSNDADAAEESKDAKQIQAVKDRYAKFVEKLDAEIRDKKGHLLVDAKEYAALVAGLSDAQQQELANLYKKQFEARSEKEYESSLQAISAYYDHERQITIEAYAQGLLDRKAYKTKLKKLDADEETDSSTVDADYAGTSKKAAKSLDGRKTKAAKKQADNRDAETDAADKDKIYAAERALLITKKGTDAELAAKKALLQAKFDADTQYLNKSGEQYKEAQAQLNKDLKDADKQYLQEKIAQVDQVMQGITSVFSAYTDLQNQKDDNVLAKEKVNNDAKRASYDSQLKKKLISQGQYDKAIAGLDADMNKRQAEITQQQAKRNKAAALFSAFINGAMGITKIWAEYAEAPYVAAALTAIEVAAVGLQVAKINEQQVPTGRKGLIVDGPSHEGGGVDLVDHNSGKVKANVEGGEPLLVLSENTYGNNRDVIDQLIFNSQQRNGARISAPWWNTPPRPVNAGRIIPLMRNGGVVASSPAGSAGVAGSSDSTGLSETNALMQQLIAKQDATITAITEQNKSFRAHVVLQDITDNQDLLKKARSVAGVNQAA